MSKEEERVSESERDRKIYKVTIELAFVKEKVDTFSLHGIMW
jgi:hypothetical protein